MTALEQETGAPVGRSDRLGLLTVIVGVDRRKALCELAARNDRSLSAETRRAIDLLLGARQQDGDPLGR
jgi:hypothetical protein